MNRERQAHRAATVAFLGLAATAALSRSASPVVLGRYSLGSFAYQVLNLVILSLLIAPARWSGIRPLGYLFVIASTFAAPVNEAVRQVPGILAVLPGVRWLAAIGLVAREFDRFRTGRRVRGPLLGLGFALAALSVLDLGLWVWVAASSGFDEDHQGFRDPYALEAVTTDDILLVGDSFVWGHGVRKPERFGDVLEGLYQREGRHVRVYSLGVRGAGLTQYLDSLNRVPERRRAAVVIVSFYPNDLAPRPRPHSRTLQLAQKATWALSRSSLTFRALHDLLGKLETPSVDHYHRSVIEDYRRDEPTFQARWEELAAALDRFALSARRRSSAAPLLVILPLMVKYRDYPLQAAHAHLAQTAERLGYDVLDLFPAFRDILGDGTRSRVSPHDNHFNARVHALVAHLIKGRLDARRDTAGIGSPVPGRKPDPAAQVEEVK